MTPKAPQSVVRGTVLLVIGRTLSRLTGLVREVLSAAFFGTGVAMDCFNLAFTFATSLRQLFAEQFFTPTLPTYFRRREEVGDAGALQSLNFITTRLLVVSLVVSSLLLIFADPLVRLAAPGFNGAQTHLSVVMVRWFAVGGIAFILHRFFMALHTCFLRYTVISFAPVLLNVGAIVGMVFFAVKYGVISLAAGFSLGFMALTLVLAFSLPQRARLLTPHWGGKDQGVKTYGLMLVPLFLAVAAEQVQLYVDRALASGLPMGALSAQGYALRLIRMSSEFWLGTFGTVILPVFASLAAKSQKEDFSLRFSLALQAMILILTFTSTLLISLALPTVRLLLERGAFDLQASMVTAKLLVYYTLAYSIHALVYVTIQGFYSFGNASKPMIATLVTVAVMIIFDFVLIKPLGIVGLAVAMALGYLVNFIIVYTWFSTRLVRQHHVATLKMFLVGLAVAGPLGYTLHFLWKWLELRGLVDTFFTRFVGLGIASGVALLIYFSIMRWLRVPALEFILQKLNAKFKGRNSTSPGGNHHG